jgi:hypothetical protein
MPVAGSDDMHRHTLVEQGGFMAAAQVVEAAGEAERLGLAVELLRDVARAAQLAEGERFARARQGREQQRVIRQADQRQVYSRAVRDARLDALQFLACLALSGRRPFGEADMAFCGNPLSRSLLGVKRTWPFAVQMSAFDPKRTYRSLQRGRTGRFL